MLYGAASSSNLTEFSSLLALYDSIIGRLTAPFFFITPIVTLVGLLTGGLWLLRAAIACNVLTVIFGVFFYVTEVDLNNPMMAFALIPSALTIIASLAGIFSSFERIVASRKNAG